MNRYRICSTDKIHAEEFKRNLDDGNFFHSPGLQRVLNVMRTGPKEGKYVLVVLKPFQKYVLAQLRGKRGQPVKVLSGHEFTSLKEAEWRVFKLRWYQHTGEHLDL